MIFLILYVSLLSQVRSIEILYKKQERFVEHGQDIVLECNYVLGKDILHSIKWYRNDHEFFRFKPNEEKPRIYQLEGLYIDNFSSPTLLKVKNVSFETSGKFRCEVTGGPPGYKTAAFNTDITVVDLPDNGPTITGVKPRYFWGDEVRAACSSDNSFPRPKIKWWINDDAADTKNIRTVDSGYTTLLRFKIKTRNSTSKLRLKCTVELLDLYWKSSEVEAKMSENAIEIFSDSTLNSGKPNFYFSPLFYTILLYFLKLFFTYNTF